LFNGLRTLQLRALPSGNSFGGFPSTDRTTGRLGEEGLSDEERSAGSPFKIRL